MSVSSWNKAVSGNYDNPAKWSGGVPILPTSEADLLAAGKPYTVTAGWLHGVGELDIGADATLAIATESVFIVSPPNGAVAGVFNLGAIDIGVGSQMIVGDPIAGSSEIFNDGAINVDGAGSTFEINAPVFELNGDGVVTLNDGAAIVAFYGPDTLDNESNTISGSGAIGDGASLTLLNGKQGVIDANGAATLTLDTGTNAIQNAGLIETTGAGGLIIESNLEQDGDLVAAGAGALTIRDAEVSGDGAISVERDASLVLDGGNLTFGGTITIAAGGVLRAAAYRWGELDAADIENAGTIRVVASSTFILAGSVSGAGRITVTGNKVEEGRLVISGGGASLSGGRLILSNSIYNNVVTDGGGGGEQFTNAGTISGAGYFGDGFLRLYNTATGVIDANDSSGLSICSDDMAVTAGSEAVNENAGTMETTGAGGLTIFGALENSGVLSADGAGALTLDGALIEGGDGVVQTIGGGSIVLDDDAAITNQTELTISAGGVLTTTTGDAGDTVVTSVFNRGTISVADDSALVVGGRWRNSGIIQLEGRGDSAALVIQAGDVWELLGDGTITLNGARDEIVSGGAGAVLDNSGSMIAGSGRLGDSEMTIDNNAGGVIEATGGMLSIDAAGFDNAGAMIATSTGEMLIDTAMTDDGRLIADSGGSIDAEDQVFGAGLAVINGAGAIKFGNVVDNNVSFRGRAMGSLIVDHSTPSEEGAAFLGEISGFAAGDTIDLRDLAFNSGQMSVSPSIFGSLDASLVVNNGATDSAAFHLLGVYTSGEFQLANDGHGGTAITLAKTV
jgi:hypothetical protein